MTYRKYTHMNERLYLQRFTAIALWMATYSAEEQLFFVTAEGEPNAIRKVLRRRYVFVAVYSQKSKNGGSYPHNHIVTNASGVRRLQNALNFELQDIQAITHTGDSIIRISAYMAKQCHTLYSAGMPQVSKHGRVRFIRNYRFCIMGETLKHSVMQSSVFAWLEMPQNAQKTISLCAGGDISQKHTISAQEIYPKFCNGMGMYFLPMDASKDNPNRSKLWRKLQDMARRKRHATAGQDTPTARQLAQLWRQNNGRDYYTGKRLPLDDLDDMASVTIEHVLPLSRGGRHELSNMAFCHVAVNSQKGDRTGLEYALWRVGHGKQISQYWQRQVKEFGRIHGIETVQRTFYDGDIS